MFILQLTHDQTGEWIEISPAGDVVSTKPVKTLSDCPKINAHDVLVILIPGEDVTLTSVKLPKMRPSERVAAAPFALEEQLATDPEQIYVALGNTAPDGTVAVAVLDKTDFDKRVQAWHEAKLYPSAALPDFLGLAWEIETWTIVIHRDMALVRTGVQSGFSVDPINLVLFLQLFLQKNPAQKPKKIMCWQQEHVLSPNTLDSFAIPVEWRDASKNKFDVAGLSSLTEFNLLQGKYRPKMQSSSIQKSWMRCGMTAAAFIGFLFFSNLVQWAYWHHEATLLQTQVRQVYVQLFPGSETVLEPRFRTDSLLKKFQQASKSGVFLKLYRIAGSTLLHFPHLHVQAIAFQDNKLVISVHTKHIQSLSEWSDALRAQSVSVQQNVSKSADNVVNAQVTLE
ncbi:MAG TPA: type II secretion system protein GspL [Coxiellaceae bacterium]|nr:type II secretion system protein GspL [Coxiellaceae bacterium]